MTATELTSAGNQVNEFFILESVKLLPYQNPALTLRAGLEEFNVSLGAANYIVSSQFVRLATD
ncbi:MAG: hypothetical protein OHK0047_14040 [Leptolyngbyaceae cyanobacterium]